MKFSFRQHFMLISLLVVITSCFEPIPKLAKTSIIATDSLFSHSLQEYRKISYTTHSIDTTRANNLIIMLDGQSLKKYADQFNSNISESFVIVAPWANGKDPQRRWEYNYQFSQQTSKGTFEKHQSFLNSELKSFVQEKFQPLSEWNSIMIYGCSNAYGAAFSYFNDNNFIDRCVLVSPYGPISREQIMKRTNGHIEIIHGSNETSVIQKLPTLMDQYSSTSITIDTFQYQGGHDIELWSKVFANRLPTWFGQ